MVPVECYFALSALLFFIGVYGFVTRRNLIAMLISVELVLNAVDINFAAVNRLLYPNGMEGMFMTLFVIGVAAAESAVAIAIRRCRIRPLVLSARHHWDWLPCSLT